jgi:trehalose synthase
MTSVASPTSLALVEVKRKSLNDYRPLVGDALVEEAYALGAKLKGLRVLHLNSTSIGGGVAELLNSLVPLEVDSGIEAHWRLICPLDEFFKVTKGFHNALQGQRVPVGEAEKALYLAQNQNCAAMLEARDYDAIIVHDPQPAAMASFLDRTGVKWVWRCHIDSSEPDAQVWDFLRPYVNRYDAAVFTMKEFVPPGLAGPALRFIAPAIDPLSPKNRALPRYLCREEVGCR